MHLRTHLEQARIRLDAGYALPGWGEVPEDGTVGLDVFPQCHVHVLESAVVHAGDQYLTERLGTLALIGEIQTAPVIRVIKRAGLRP
ncbi:hypothetical protein [Nonomuraea aurantiaca]|uniref:hypothetical protein n=1 Tax=Nonomuraea aurantiaca TaxID=2878562 RepID=UPI001CD92F91|nr:hypothetical protein [Nonomuraea aurantiaca]MCA2224866.1 hypothetical protein [Nonomuraea aurantiaca]